MTIIEAINKVDELKPNTYSQSQKIAWLSTLDGTVKKKIIDTHEDGESVVFNGYTDDTDLSTTMLICEPYTDAYIFWLESKIDYNNREYANYNNSIIKFNEMFGDFSRDYNRNHMPIGVKVKFF